MATMDIFNNPGFSAMSLSGMVDKLPYAPTLLDQLGIFEPMPVRTRQIFVDRREGSLALIGTSADGAPPEDLAPEDRDLVPLRTTRLTKRFTLYAAELDGIRAFGSETELEAVQTEYARRAARLKADMSLTHEYHRLGALQGILLDADGSTVIRNYYNDFGVTQSTTTLDLTSTSTKLRSRCNAIARGLLRKAGATGYGTIHALIGDSAYDALTDHPEVRGTYLNWAAAADLRAGKVFDDFTFGGITWHNYRGTDDNSTVAVPTNGIRFFPVGVPGVFKKAMAPLESLDFVGSPGQDTYMMNIPDRDRNMWVKGEIYSYPLYFCQRPDLLLAATATLDA